MKTARLLAAWAVALAAALPSLADTPAYRNLDGNYFSDRESGWGVNIVQGASGNLMVAWLGSLSAHRWPVWVMATGGTWTSPTRFEATLQHVRTSSFGAAWDPSAVQVTPAGTIVLAFLNEREVEFEGRITLDRLVIPPFEKKITLRRMEF